MNQFTALATAFATLLLAACTEGAGPPPQTLAERNELADAMVGTDPLTTGTIPPADPGGLQ